MATPVEMPKLGNTVEECLIASWKKRKGDSVAAGDIIAEIETDKTNFELTAPASGTILDVFFAEGALVPVFTSLCVIGEAGENAEAFRPQPVAAPATTAPAAVAATREPGATRARAVDGAALTTAGAVTAAAAPAVVPPAPSVAPPAPAFFSPRARRFAQEHSFHPARVMGSGPDGRVLEDDLRRLFFSTSRVSTTAQRYVESGYEIRGSGSGIGGMIRAGDLGPPPVRIPSIREKIARRMRESLLTSAQYTLHSSADAAGLLAVRKKVKASGGLPDININDLVVYCAVKALMDMPELNAEFIDGKLYRHTKINMGFACDTDRGLMVPVVKDCQKLSVADLSSRLKALAAQAILGTIGADDLSGGTFTVSNLGNLGIESFTPLINPPQVAILGVDAIQLKPVRGKAGNVEFIDSIGLSLTCDHQMVDGAPGARFLRIVKEKIESVESLCTI